MNAETPTDRPAMTMREIRERLGHTIPPDAAEAPAATCSAQHHGHGKPRLCIRAAQHHRLAHTDEHGFHWSDTVAVYPVADGGERTGPPAVSSPAPADRAALRQQIIDGLYEARRPGLGGMTEAEAVAHMADAVLAVLPAPVDRAAVLRDFLWRLEQSAGDAAAEKFLDDNPELRRLADEAPQPEAEAQPPYHRWSVETRDAVADQWTPGTPIADRDKAVERYEHVTTNWPAWKDGTPVRRRLVRATTTYTVEAGAAAAEQLPEAAEGAQQ
jgi:hypothetical protein